MPRSVRVRRRDFSRHWALSPLAKRAGRPLVRALELPAAVPAPVFVLMLGLLALGASVGRRPWALGLWLFMVTDWAMLALLPRLGRSFGSPQPAAMTLALPRAALALLPVPLLFAASLQVVGSALAFYALWIEPHRITLTRETLRSPKLRSGAPVCILHLGDLHVERVTARERQVVQLVESLRPDLVLFSGDLMNVSYVRDPKTHEACRWVLARLSGPLGVYLVSGGSATAPEEVLSELVAGLPVRWLRDRRVTLEHRGQTFDVVGLDCTHKPFLERPRLEAVLAGDRKRFTILLYHTPDLAPDAAELGVDLMLSGHTHGGQVRLPLFGAVFTSSLYGKAFEMGRYQLDGLTLYVTRGIGMEGSGAPRVRFLCPPEIVLWELDGSPT
ncbi:MAG: hypothetical protein E6K73_06940 [Candidatus Eisenbacteria bacterium]|uniref:Calcineurin-like phosphoesterase domain-containing protein n=1 Tax=Eiseniibacteriota bacterium TaxID=2212470 RepID=A0A538SHW4_UNCEI|nr:MAG: hypothetical protein E6K73_06940 [Candidatus Eisenbacteria bacterium]